MAHLLDRCGTHRPADRDVHSVGGALRHADARGLFTAGRSAYDNGVLSRSMRRLPPAARDVHRATAPFGTQTPAAGFAPPTRHARPLIFSPHATYRRQISSYKFLLSPSQFPVAAPIGPPLRAVGHRPAGTGAVCSSFLSAPRRRDSNGPFFSSSGSARSRRFARPPSGIVSVALPRPPLGGRSPTTSAAQSPESRLCGGLSASIHPLHSPHRPCPKIIVLRSASL